VVFAGEHVALFEIEIVQAVQGVHMDAFCGPVCLRIQRGYILCHWGYDLLSGAG
jgi:hypothetical protein